jgi:hypothetical protein
MAMRAHAVQHVLLEREGVGHEAVEQRAERVVGPQRLDGARRLHDRLVGHAGHSVRPLGGHAFVGVDLPERHLAAARVQPRLERLRGRDAEFGQRALRPADGARVAAVQIAGQRVYHFPAHLGRSDALASVNWCRPITL